MYYRNRQSGAAVSYIIIGIVLVALALGALYGARQYMASQRTAPISVEDMQTASNESDDKSSEESKPDDKKDQKSADQDKEKESNDSKDENSTKEDSNQAPATSSPESEESKEGQDFFPSYAPFVLLLFRSRNQKRTFLQPLRHLLI